MRKARLVIATLAVCALALGIGPVAFAQPGPDPDVGPFDIIVKEAIGPDSQTYNLTHFDTTRDWDWGLRAAYTCAYVEFFSDGQLMFEVHYELLKDYPTPVQILDNAGSGQPVNGTLGDCGDGISPEASMSFDGSDHFPHGTALNFYRDAQPLTTLDYHSADMCANGYWTPGDEPGEAWLWWDQDGPQSTMPDMEDCNGGPGEPLPVVRAYVQNRAPGVGVCTEDQLDGDTCVNRFPPPTIASLSPTSGTVGTSVTITGTNFSEAHSVKFGGVPAASFTVNSSTQITATVPVADTGPVSVTSPDGTAVSASSFEVTTPSHKRTVSLNLPRTKAKGTVTVSDGFDRCASGVPVKVQRSVNGKWQTVARLITGASGKFKTGGIGDPGRYRAIAMEVTMGDHICMQETSPVARQ